MPLIEINKLTKIYRMGDSLVRALDGVDLSIERGEFVAITGASGSGKSTMMHLIGCLDRPTSGSYVLDGQRVSELGDWKLAAIRNGRIGFVFQTFNLIQRTSALENVAVPLFYAGSANPMAQARRALERVGLGARASHKPNELSGGERQRVAIARAIVNDPPLLLADEPTGNLDSRTGEQIMQVFHDLNAQGVTIVLVTHEHDVAMQARRIVQMRDGRILFDKPTSEVPAEHFILRAGRAPAAHAPRSAARARGASQGDGGGVATLAPPERPGEFAEEAGGMERSRPIEPEELPPQRIPGAFFAMLCGIFSLSIFVCGWIIAKVVTWGLPPPPKGQMPDTPYMIAGLSMMGAALLGMTAGIVAVAIAVRMRAKVRKTRGTWIGWGSLRLGFWLGLTGIVLPPALMIFGIVMTIIKGRA